MLSASSSPQRPNRKFNPIQGIILRLIRWYQVNFSPDHSAYRQHHPHGYCRYNPTCSEYGYQAIERYGVIVGGVKAIWRILRCNPWSKGGYDPLR